MKNISIWSDIKRKKNFKELNKNLEVDICIIGAGITGLSTAYHLINKNLKICIIERNTIASGVSSKTTGKLTYLQDNIYNKLKKYHGLFYTKLYLDSQIDAINMVKSIIENNNIDCNLEQVKSYIFTNSNVKKLNKEIDLLKKLKVNINKTNVMPNKDIIKNSFYVNDTYVFNPIKYLYSLANICINNNIEIYENTNIISIDKENELFICKTKNNTIKSKYVVLATHYPYFLLPFLTPLKTYIEKSYIGAYKVKDYYRYSSINIDKPTISTRYYKDNNINYKIYLTNSHNTCIKDNDSLNFKPLINNNLDYIWSNKDIITNDKLPFIGLVDNNFLIATGYNTWGMSNGSIAGKVLSDIILKKKNKYINLFDPKRNLNIGKVITFPLILSSNIYSFIKSKIIKNKSWYNSNVIFEKRKGKNIAIYIDKNNKKHIVYNLCPHLKCSLIFNEIERTWDCPCHGSRFDIDGNILEGPSNYDIKYKE